MKKIIYFIATFSTMIAFADVDPIETLEAIEAATGWTAEELSRGLAMLDHVYSNDCKKTEGRIRWHGPITNTVFDMTALTKSQYHADGFVHIEKFSSKTHPSLYSQLSAAEKKAIENENRRIANERRERIKNDRIAELTTNMAAEVSALMESRRWPEELARLYLQDELNKLIGTNSVNAIITPGT